MTSPNLPVTDLKYCTFYEKNKSKSNVTKIFKYICYSNEICCDHGNGCCPQRSTKYYESWGFWVFILATVLGCYLLCWYCKKLEKERQAVRVNVDNGRNTPPILSPRLGSVEPRSVDHLLETLILSYRNRLASDQHQPIQNVEKSTIFNNIDPPPKYIDALKMPKPLKPDLNTTSITGNSASNSNESNTTHNEQGGSNEDNFVVVEITDDEDVPSYEEAIKRI